ncbi:MAG: hypothetical protein U5R48_06510 [Gammaproteobacteria bacterium]|nr:hypothetical protein [Gammaproteobacteria bacterium]
MEKLPETAPAWQRQRQRQLDLDDDDFEFDFPATMTPTRSWRLNWHAPTWTWVMTMVPGRILAEVVRDGDDGQKRDAEELLSKSSTALPRLAGNIAPRQGSCPKRREHP